MGSFGAAISLELCQLRSVQLLTQHSPLWQVLVKQPRKALVVMTLRQMRQLVHKDVLQALHWLFGQRQIQPNAPGFEVALPPFGLHTFGAPSVNRNAQDLLPLSNSSGTSFVSSGR
jgi:hypothetical protein